MSRTSAMLTGLSLVTGVARDAADGVPIVKQVLGVASRIVGLAEQIDKNREDLHALADRAKKMDSTIAAIVDDREVGDRMLRRLEDVNGVLHAVEKVFHKHIKRGRVRTTLGYIFTIRKEVDRLRGEFDECLRELEVAAALDTNIVSRENSRFIGEFRNIRHSEISVLRPVSRVERNTTNDTTFCHFATCEGSSKLFVVRDMIVYGHNEAHYRILEHLSLIQNRHPAIACLYGRNNGPRDNRFIVLEAGDIHPLEDEIRAGTADITVLGKIVARLADVSLHLQKHGAVWGLYTFSKPAVYVDSNYNPTIGIDEDLNTMWDYPGRCASTLARKLGHILGKSTKAWLPHENPIADQHRTSITWSKELFGEVIESGYRALRRENMVRRADVASLIPFSQESWTYLHHKDRSYACPFPDWGMVLLRLATGTVNCEGSLVEALYLAHRSGQPDQLLVFCIDGDIDVVCHTETHIEIPPSAAEGVRQRLGIAVGAEEVYPVPFYLQRPTRHFETGWTGWSAWYAPHSPW